MSRAENREHLESGVLKLPSPVLHYGSYYREALISHALPLMDLLAQLKDEGIKRTNPVLAEYSSVRGGQDFLFADTWKRDLEAAINDLGYAAGLRVAVGYHDGSGFQLPEQFKGLLPSLQLPPTLQRRIDPRKVELDKELNELIRASNEQRQRILNPSGQRYVPIISDIQKWLERRRVGETEPSLEIQPDFRLGISFDVDKRSYGPDYQRDTWSYHRLIHTISLVPAE